MYAILSLVIKYALVFLIYLFIYRVTKLIYKDIKSLVQSENKKQAMPHLKRYSTLNSDAHPLVSEIIPLVKHTTQIGRATTCDVILPEQHISSVHATIEWTTQGYFITDLTSVNGTFVNDQKISQATPLKPGDRIRIGHVVLVYSEGDTHEN